MDVNAARRVLDANGNRAREALRTLEEVGRFVLDDAALAGEAKRLRHGLRDALPDATDRELALNLSARDTDADVGTRLTTTHERDRPDLTAVATAAGKRLGEALRQLEEFGKLVPGVDTSAIKALRYAGYTLERRVLMRLSASRRGRQWRLCLLLTVAACRLPWDRVLRESLAAGVDYVQIREKPGESALSSNAELLNHAQDVVARVRAFSAEHPDRPAASVVVNDRPDVAVACGADGVHLGQDDVPVSAARKIVGPTGLIGVSTHRIEDAQQAEADGADYCGVGPMFASGTKAKTPAQVAAAGPDYLRDYLGACALPHLAIGGITADRLDVLVDHGVRGVAVCDAICGSENPGAAARSLLDALPRDDAGV